MKKNESWFIIGIGAGVAMGVALNNVAVGTALGAGIGLALSGQSTACVKRAFAWVKRS